MAGFNHAEEERPALKLPSQSDNRVSRESAILVICVLSILCWAVMAAVIFTVRAFFLSVAMASRNCFPHASGRHHAGCSIPKPIRAIFRRCGATHGARNGSRAARSRSASVKPFGRAGHLAARDRRAGDGRKGDTRERQEEIIPALHQRRLESDPARQA
jgi:hypothetical protein